ncbi:hypothetical protein CDAR_77861 [Caerostris darwini]|uniref:Uncharacterized protein n=1 Tax=Caerostris darwini TaxID=1538125 RepID=A0AAV4NC10_9ARAC|nr:hypothetical protein CDAR_77861 [Caerostris darwini]
MKKKTSRLRVVRHHKSLRITNLRHEHMLHSEKQHFTLHRTTSSLSRALPLQNLQNLIHEECRARSGSPSSPLVTAETPGSRVDGEKLWSAKLNEASRRPLRLIQQQHPPPLGHVTHDGLPHCISHPS